MRDERTTDATAVYPELLLGERQVGTSVSGDTGEISAAGPAQNARFWLVKQTLISSTVKGSVEAGLAEIGLPSESFPKSPRRDKL
jgi:hypothetical protein